MRSLMIAAWACLVLALPALAADAPPKKPVSKANAAKKVPARPKAPKHVRVYSKDGVPGYKDTDIQPWSGYHVHDPDRPVPRKIEPGQPGIEERPGKAPSDAMVLFDGRGMDAWLPAPEWTVKDGLLVAGSGNLASKEEFGDCQVHVEWQAPDEPTEKPSNRGNNGVQFLKAIEVQIFDSYSEKIYPDGQAGSIYGQTPPRVNACRKPAQWQSYDIVFIAPRFKDGKLLEPARITLLHNGVLVHHNQEVYGSTPHARLGTYEGMLPKGPLALMGHHCPVEFRNIWVRRLER